MQHTQRCTTLFSIDKSPNQCRSAGTLLPKSEKATSVESAISLRVTRLQSTEPLLSLVFPHFLPAVITNKMLSPRTYPRRGLGSQDCHKVSWDSNNQSLPKEDAPTAASGFPQAAPSKSTAGRQFSAPLRLTLGWTPGRQEDEELSLCP